MQCPRCPSSDTKVLETRPGKENTAIRRRRECPNCHYRFTTFEEIHRQELWVVKQDTRLEPFQKEKILKGIRRAIQKRPIQAPQVEKLLFELTEFLEKEYEDQVPSQVIGEWVMLRLKALDQISYVRYASVYKDFADIAQMAAEIAKLNPPNQEKS